MKASVSASEEYTLRIKSKAELFAEQLMRSATRHVYDPNDPGKEERAFQERIRKIASLGNQL